jgi:hypothetical protein
LSARTAIAVAIVFGFSGAGFHAQPPFSCCDLTTKPAAFSHASLSFASRVTAYSSHSAYAPSSESSIWRLPFISANEPSLLIALRRKSFAAATVFLYAPTL